MQKFSGQRLVSSLFASLFFSINAFSLNVWADDHSSVKEAILPPVEPWKGKSESLIVEPEHPWLTPAEKMNLINTPTYDETFQYVDRLVASDRRLSKLSLGKSPQGRDIWMLVANNEGLNTPQSILKQGKPTLLVQAGIHSGEIDGKDAGLMLLRDILHSEKSQLIESVNLLFVPILSVDGHERRSPFNRVNQRGPSQMGWRTNSQNLNLNRDYMKLDTPELQHMIKAINLWQPDLYFDVHVTDGEDYQYDITYGFTSDFADSPNISRWLSKKLKTTVDKALADNGHLGGPLTFGVDSMEFSKGISGWTASPRFSNGYGDVRQLPTVLIENHSLKPYKRRVLGTYVMLEATLKLLAQQGSLLRAAILEDKSARPKHQVVSWAVDIKNPETMDFAGIEYRKAKDPITGLDYIQWTGKPKTYKDLPIYWSRLPKEKVKVAKNYWLPPQYTDVIERLKIHGVQFTQLKAPKKIKAIQFVAQEVKLSEKPFEGHQQPQAVLEKSSISVTLPAGTLQIKSDQDLGRLAVALLDPRAPDSFYQWGFFNQMFQRTEYIESYAIVPLAKKMLEKDPGLKKSFEEIKAKDKTFADSPRAQLRWFYERSAFYDQEYLKYPVLLEF